MEYGRITLTLIFQLNEMRSFIKEIVDSCPNGRSCGSDGVIYEDLKKMFEEHGDVFVNILNVMLVNKCIPSLWKNCIIHRCPKKNFSNDDLTTLRDISLLPSSYKVFSKAICKRITPYFSNVVAFWQRAFLRKRDRQELIYTLKTAIDDFRHLSAILNVVFIDFAGAFGSIKHDLIFEMLMDF